MSLKTISAYVVFFGLKIVLKASIRSSGTLTAPRCTSPPNPVGTLSPVNVLNTVVLPEPANPTRPTFIEDLPVRRFSAPVRSGGTTESFPAIKATHWKLTCRTHIAPRRETSRSARSHGHPIGSPHVPVERMPA